MAYTKTVWKDLPDTSTPINATNLNKIENELENIENTSYLFLGNYGENKWQKLFNLKFGEHNQGEFVAFKIFIGKGSNGTVDQNAYIDLIGQLGWTGSVGGRAGWIAKLYSLSTPFTINNIEMKVIANSNVDYDVWFKTTLDSYCRPNVYPMVDTQVTLTKIFQTYDYAPTGTECNLDIIGEIVSKKINYTTTDVVGADMNAIKTGNLVTLNFGALKFANYVSENGTVLITGLPKPTEYTIFQLSVYTPGDNQSHPIRLAINVDGEIVIHYSTNSTAYGDASNRYFYGTFTYITND